jgi:hypothetical protein
MPSSPEAVPAIPDSLLVHTAYRDRKLFIWGESRHQEGRAGGLEFAVPTRLRHAVWQIAEKLHASCRNATIRVPTDAEAIRPMSVPAVILDAENALYFLDACNRNPYAQTLQIKIAYTTRFWGAALRLVAALAARDRFLPSVSIEGRAFDARWKPKLAAPDRLMLRELAANMPPPARAITFDSGRRGKPPEDDPAVLLGSFVAWIMDALPRIAMRTGRTRALPRAVNDKNIGSARFPSRLKMQGSGGNWTTAFSRSSVPLRSPPTGAPSSRKFHRVYDSVYQLAVLLLKQ